MHGQLTREPVSERECEEGPHLLNREFCLPDDWFRVSGLRCRVHTLHGRNQTEDNV